MDVVKFSKDSQIMAICSTIKKNCLKLMHVPLFNVYPKSGIHLISPCNVSDARILSWWWFPLSRCWAMLSDKCHCTSCIISAAHGVNAKEYLIIELCRFYLHVWSISYSCPKIQVTICLLCECHPGETFKAVTRWTLIQNLTYTFKLNHGSYCGLSCILGFHRFILLITG